MTQKHVHDFRAARFYKFCDENFKIRKKFLSFIEAIENMQVARAEEFEEMCFQIPLEVKESVDPRKTE